MNTTITLHKIFSFIVQSIKFTLVTLIFLAVIAAVAYETWTLSRSFINDSYKVVAFFLGLILAANITSKYLIWSMGNWT